MAKAIQQIEKELEALEEQVSAIAQNLEKLYQEYVEILGTTLQQQLIFSVYQICTHEYPQAFLELSLSQQQAFQKKMRELGKEAQEHLKLGGEVLQSIAWEESEEEENSDSEEETEETNFNPNSIKELLNNQPSEPEENSPENVIAWLNLQAEAITMILENVSSNANEILRQAGILPQEFPKEMLDAAVRSEGAGSISNRAPGVLHLMLELERKNNSKKSDEDNEVIQLAIVRLRAAELEFSAPNLNRKRREIRTLEQQLHQLDEQYQKLEQERAIAQAELAWNSSWHQD